ncbi:MAG: hypothetical protein ACREEM_30690 [Blastocatellia bacterium]
MNNELFVLSLALVFGAFFVWAFRALPREQWQIIAAVPRMKTEAGAWQGLNLTWYGFFQATSNTLAVAILLVLLGAIGIPALETFALVTVVFAVCWPASRLIALAGAYLYLQSHFVATLVFTMAGTQAWRFLSEMLRADVRGQATSFSAYQAMALVAILYLIGIAAFTETAAPAAEIAAGLNLLWNPAVLLFGQALWVAVFLTTGRSMVTGSTVWFFVHQDRI